MKLLIAFTVFIFCYVVNANICTVDQCDTLCNQVFPNRGCLGKCISDTECDCSCSKMK